MSRGSNLSPLSAGFGQPLSCINRLMHGGRSAIPWLGLILLCFGFALSLPGRAAAQSANTWNKRGQTAELKEDYDAAFEDYKQAHLKNLKDIRFRERMERMRFQAAAQHVDRGRILRENGDFAGALTNFNRALEIDPSNQTAQQEIGITQRMQPSPQASGVGAVAAMQQLVQQAQVLKDISSISGPVKLKPVSNDAITLHMVEDVKVIYQAIGKLAGLNVLFDPEYTSKRIPVDLTNVTLSDALRIVGTISGTFYKPVTENTIFVAQNTRTKRSDLDDLAVQTFYLSNSSQANDGNEILTGLRLLLDPSVKLYLVPSQNAIVMRGTTDELLLAQKLINDFDRARPEVVVDVAVLEVNRDLVRNLGITLPQSFGLTPQVSNASTTTTSGTTVTTTGTTSTATNTQNLTLNNLANINATNFAVSITGGTVNALLTDSDTRILQNPRIRSTDGQRATLKIGSKIPIATGSYNAGVSTGVASIGVQTQFTYLDVGVNIDMTPTVHQNRDISLKMAVEVSSQSGSVTISSVTEPIISQRKSEQVIQLQDGEPSILAGIITHQDNHTVSGTPFLGEIPFFKYLFSTQSKETQQDEIVFLLIPHIVRESVLTRLNTAPIDTGPLNGIELRHADATDAPLSGSDLADPSLYRPNTAPGQQTTAANGAVAALQQLHQQAQPPTPRQMQGQMPSAGAAATVQPNIMSSPPNASVSMTGAPISFTVQPSSPNQAIGSTFVTNVALTGGQDVYSVPLQVQFDPKVLQLVNVDAGEFLQRDRQMVTVVHREDNGVATISMTRPPQAAGISGNGAVCALTFKAIGPGDARITLVKVGAKNSKQASMPATGADAVVHVK